MERGRVRKRGHPNRGGGKFNRGRGGAQRSRGQGGVQRGQGRGRGQQPARGVGGGKRGGGSGFQRKGFDDLDDWEDRPLDGLPGEDEEHGYHPAAQSREPARWDLRVINHRCISNSINKRLTSRFSEKKSVKFVQFS